MKRLDWQYMCCGLCLAALIICGIATYHVQLASQQHAEIRSQADNLAFAKAIVEIQARQVREMRARDEFTHDHSLYFGASKPEQAQKEKITVGAGITYSPSDHMLIMDNKFYTPIVSTTSTLLTIPDSGAATGTPTSTASSPLVWPVSLTSVR